MFANVKTIKDEDDIFSRRIGIAVFTDDEVDLLISALGDYSSECTLDVGARKTICDMVLQLTKPGVPEETKVVSDVEAYVDKKINSVLEG